MSIRVGLRHFSRVLARGLVAVTVKFTEPWGELYSEPPTLTSIFTEPWTS